ncbi:ketohexokinase-like [Xenia sp. Carnegie-2017]|uniref:ketohexokinase-like n=1 Tax=Xenia sp. Carnegie-2017 TaxID=2897299 RepID=UPI001F04D812|nr:ketohexokinase-like [Xenia sp. Carnegie-2017]
MEDIIREEKRKVLIVGLACLDIVNTVDSYPKEDEDMRALSQKWQKGGNAANTAVILRQTLKVNCDVLCSFNTDMAGRFVRGELERRGISTDNCPLHENCGFPTSCVVVNHETGSRTIIHSRNNLPELSFSHFDELDLTLYTWIHFEGRRNELEIKKMIKKIRDFNRTHNIEIKISVELEKKRDELKMLLTIANVVFIGKDYAQFLGYSSPQECVNNLSKEVKSGTILICPWGEQGAVGYICDGELYSSTAYPPVKVVDTLGAGDTFVAGVIYCMNQGMCLKDALEFGCKLAGMKCGIEGFDSLTVPL